MSTQTTEADDAADRVRQLLREVDERLAAADGDGGLDSDAMEDFGELAARANELVSESDPGTLLEAVDGFDGSEVEPASLSEAIAQSDPETVVSLRKLLTLSKMGEAQESDTLGAHIEELRDLYDIAETEHNGGTEDESRETASSERESNGDETAAGEESDYSERIKGMLQDGINEFREGMRTTRAALEENDEPGRERNESDPTGSQTGDGTMFRTIPSKNRADMRVSTRFSTVRNQRNNSRD